MTIKAVETFLQKLAQDEALQDKLAQSKQVEQIHESDQLNDEDLETVAGGCGGCLEDSSYMQIPQQSSNSRWASAFTSVEGELIASNGYSW
ncbi:MAG: Nif11 family protein [Rivularia sp. (in: cyanobacteria)]|jgi:hypothetical protein